MKQRSIRLITAILAGVACAVFIGVQHPSFARAPDANASGVYLSEPEARWYAKKKVRWIANRGARDMMYVEVDDDCDRYSGTKVGCWYYYEVYHHGSGDEGWCEGELQVRETADYYYWRVRHQTCDDL